IRKQGHEAGAFDGVLDGTLESCARAAALAAEEVTLAIAQLFQTLDILIIDESRPRAAVFRAKTAAVLAASTELLANHRITSPSRWQTSVSRRKETIKIAMGGKAVNACGRRTGARQRIIVGMEPLEILYEDNHCLAVVKPGGVVCAHFQGKEE